MKFLVVRFPGICYIAVIELLVAIGRTVLNDVRRLAVEEEVIGK